MPAGTPRGFNLANMPMMPGGFGTAFSAQSGFSPFPAFGPHAVQVPGGWAGGAPPMNMDGDGGHQVGPMRRGGGRFQAQRPGPYDRRQPRYTSGSGRFSPPRGGMGMQMGGRIASGGNRWGDGVGAQAVGPKEAVQGRSLKSYDDLDAVAGGAAGGGGGATGELNY
jgi:hypothetical protein